jgi:hypothetical protein
LGEFGERGRDAPMSARVDTEFVVAAPNVLYEGEASHNHACGVVAFESTHRAEPGLEPAVVGLDPVIRVLGRVVEHGRHELIHDGEKRPCPIGHHLDRLAVIAERRDEARRRYLSPALNQS